jgi:hypothetical protein
MESGTKVQQQEQMEVVRRVGSSHDRGERSVLVKFVRTDGSGEDTWDHSGKMGAVRITGISQLVFIFRIWYSVLHGREGAA